MEQKVLCKKKVGTLYKDRNDYIEEWIVECLCEPTIKEGCNGEFR